MEGEISQTGQLRSYLLILSVIASSPKGGGRGKAPPILGGEGEVRQSELLLLKQTPLGFASLYTFKCRLFVGIFLTKGFPRWELLLYKAGGTGLLSTFKDR